MGFAQFIKKKFLGKEICISINNGEQETLILEQFWIQNREYFQGVVKEVVEDIIVLEIPTLGSVYMNPDDISYIWEPPFDVHSFIRRPSKRH